MPRDETKKEETPLADKRIVEALVGFFDLLARFDSEDNRNQKMGNEQKSE